MGERENTIMKKVTIQDIAKKLNLSRNTVAKALNNSDTVSYETRFLVIETAYEMGYSKLSPVVLNEFKVRNKVDETKSIVVLTKREISFFANSVLMGISDELNMHGCKLQLNFVREQDEKNMVLPLDFKEEVSGVIILSIFSDEYISQIVKQNVPIVFLDGPVELSNTSKYGDVIISEGRNSIRTITLDLISRGLTKIGFIGDITYSKTIYERYEGYLAALNNADITPDPLIVANQHTGNMYYKKEEVEVAIDKFPYMPEAIVCANDDIALFTIRYLNSKGLSIPEDVAVTGYDNIEVTSQTEPMLTTVRIGNQRLGRRLVQKLMWRLQNPSFPKEVIFINSEVIFRESSQKMK